MKMKIIQPQHYLSAAIFLLCQFILSGCLPVVAARGQEKNKPEFPNAVDSPFNATSILNTGDHVRVNGGAGTVKILQRKGE